ncbi:MAG: PEGA domain-containing protein [Polyangiaceae bacterium]|nr:PEGA domain-containing protein [Polyangiaceae bacterium]
MRYRTLGSALGFVAVGLFAAHSAAQPAPSASAKAPPAPTAKAPPPATAAPATAAPATTAAPAASGAPAAGSAAPQAAPTAQPTKPLAESLTGVAKAEYEGAKILYVDKDYASAIAKFQRAYELSSDPRLLFNIAVCQKNLRKYSKMLATIRRYLEDGAAILTADDKAQAQEIVKTVEAFVSELKLTVDEADAEVYIDDEKLGITPLASQAFLDVGVRKITVKKKGFKDFVSTKQVPGGGPIALDVRLEKEVHRGKLLVTAGVNDVIYIDGKVYGRGKWEGSLPSGGHTLKVSAPGMQNYQSEVVIQDNQTRRVDVTLNTQATDSTTTILWIAGGAAVLAGAAVSGALLFQPPKNPPVEGNFGSGTVQLNYGKFGFGFGGAK